MKKIKLVTILLIFVIINTTPAMGIYLETPKESIKNSIGSNKTIPKFNKDIEKIVTKKEIQTSKTKLSVSNKLSSQKSNKSMDYAEIKENASRMSIQIESLLKECSNQIEVTSDAKKELEKRKNEVLVNKEAASDKLERFELTSSNLEEYQELENSYTDAANEIYNLDQDIGNAEQILGWYKEKREGYQVKLANVKKLMQINENNAPQVLKKYNDYLVSQKSQKLSTASFQVINDKSNTEAVEYSGNDQGLQTIDHHVNYQEEYDQNGEQYANQLINETKDFALNLTHKDYSNLTLNDIVQLNELHGNSSYNYEYYIFGGYANNSIGTKYVLLLDSSGNQNRVILSAFKDIYTGNVITCGNKDPFEVLSALDKAIFEKWDDEYKTTLSEYNDVKGSKLIVTNTQLNAIPLLTIPSGILLATLWAGLGRIITAETAKQAALVAARSAAVDASLAAIEAAGGVGAVDAGAVATDAAVVTATANVASTTYMTILSVTSTVLFWLTVVVAIVAIAYVSYVAYQYYKRNSKAEGLNRKLNELNSLKPKRTY